MEAKRRISVKLCALFPDTAYSDKYRPRGNRHNRRQSGLRCSRLARGPGSFASRASPCTIDSSGEAARVDGLSLFEVVDLLSVFIGALTGVLVARRLRYDITGHWALGLVSGLGGGLIRDVLLQVGPPLALVEPAYLPTVLAATLVSALFGSCIDQLRKTILVVDAFAISAFAVAGNPPHARCGPRCLANDLAGGHYSGRWWCDPRGANRRNADDLPPVRALCDRRARSLPCRNHHA